LAEDIAPARLNSITQSGRVAIQKCPLARTTLGSAPCSTARIFSGTKGRRAW
jgi:hypothetical protein